MSIRPLPGDVIAQIRSSTVITSLNAVVCGLLENSLDAGASRVNISVDYGRGNCSVQDDGVGIAPDDFQDGGGLGNLHYTSKYPPQPDCHGRRGEFLASVASLSLLTVASHHREYRTHNSVTIHNGRVVNRQLPVPSDQRILAFPSGTRVVVRDLFGSMPVRVKQRAIELEQGGSLRDFDQLVHRITALLLPWPGQVSVSLQDAYSHRSVHFRASDVPDWTQREANSALLSRTTALLSQSSMVDDGDLKHWVPVGATAPGISVKGCVSLQPVATKRVQFIALGVRPLLNDLHANIFYEDINAVFDNSSFGVLEEATLDDDGRPTKTQGFTGKELKPKRGVDRWPMFFLRITLSNGSKGTDIEQLLHQRDAGISSISDLLQMMAYELLQKHHFRPKPVAAMERMKKEAKSSGTPNRGPRVVPKREPKRTQSSRKSARRAATDSPPRTACPFDSWARGKSSIPTTKPSKNIAVSGQSEHFTDARMLPLRVAREVSEPLFDKSGHLLRKPFDAVEETTTEGNSEGTSLSGTDSPREVVVWVDPRTKIKSLIDARTGFAVKDSRREAEPDAHRPTSREPGISLSSTRSRSSTLATTTSLFPRTEPPIPYLAQVVSEPTCCNHKQHPETASITLLRTTLEGRIFKPALRTAQVLGQVDRKFILAKVASTPPSTATRPVTGTEHTLVLIDQHAADERCRVEELFASYFVPSSSSSTGGVVADTQPLHRPLRFDLPRRDGELLARAQGWLKHWGVVYEVFQRQQEREESKEVTVEVQALPPSILERCRLEPRLLVDLLRREVWKRHGAGGFTEYRRVGDGVGGGDWVTRFHDCPEGILEMIHSRACRSAIMFNDLLTLEQCKELVGRLAGCKFPFQCAHGRPSMVPLVHLGEGMGSKRGGERNLLVDLKRWRTARGDQ
ncbi:hypothetical protein VTJ49DRAFT_2231 [Mycothermus thermophilus]|uniref:MutL C-terminal dimerisation domain-containing protein n=1 Tax=Humicola insolens TaxID=85995 RepID=A0ABR3VAA6_HUMIN